MKEKILWIITASIFCSAYILLNVFPINEYHADRSIWWLLNIGVMLVFNGLHIFPLTALIALLLPKDMSYKQRFNTVLPFSVILLGLGIILATLTNSFFNNGM